MLRLDLLRHAKTEPDHEEGDHERVLLPRGRKDAVAVGQELARRGYVPALVLCSSARRAAQTLDLVAPFLLPAPEIRIDPALYLAAPQSILMRLAGLPSDATEVLVIGHNPGMHQLAVSLAGGRKSAGRLGEKFGTAAFASFESQETAWTAAVRGRWQLRDEFRPADLRGS